MGEMVADDDDTVEGDRDKDRDGTMGDRRGSSNSATTNRTSSRDGTGNGYGSSGRTPISSVALALMDVLYTNLTVLQYPLRGSHNSSSSSSSSSSSNNNNSGNGIAGNGISNGTKNSSSSSSSGVVLPPLLPMHFAGDLNGMGVIAGKGSGSGSYGGGQFRAMVDVAMWLCRLIGGQVTSTFPFPCLPPSLPPPLSLPP